MRSKASDHFEKEELGVHLVRDTSCRAETNQTMILIGLNF